MAFFPRFYGEFRAIFRRSPSRCATSTCSRTARRTQARRRQVPQDQGRTGESRDQRAAARDGREEQAHQVLDHREAGLHGAARSRVKRAARSPRATCQELDLYAFQASTKSLTARMKALLTFTYVASTRFPHDHEQAQCLRECQRSRAFYSSMTAETACWPRKAVLEQQGCVVTAASVRKRPWSSSGLHQFDWWSPIPACPNGRYRN